MINYDTTITGTVIYLEKYVGEVLTKFPYFYVDRNNIYTLSDSKGGETFEEYDGKRVEIKGNVFINPEFDVKMLSSFEIKEI